MEGKLLIVEDKDRLRESLEQYFSREGFQVETAADGREALGKLIGTPPQLVILDVQLPFMDGLELCRQIRHRFGYDVDVVMVSGERIEMLDRVVGLELGADAYLVKPFETRELLAQVRALLRRRQALLPEVSAGGWTDIDGRLRIHFQRRAVEVNGADVYLSRLEFDLLQYLARNPGIPFARSDLLDAVWGYQEDDGYSDSAVNTCISKLRAKIEENPGDPQYIISVHAVGYRFRSW